MLLGQNKNVTPEHFDNLRLICNGAGPVKEADGQRIIARSKNKNLRFIQGITFFFFFNLKYLLYINIRNLFLKKKKLKCVEIPKR